MWKKSQFTVDFLTCTKEVLNKNPNLLCSTNDTLITHYFYFLLLKCDSEQLSRK